ncbi:hypothetical protein LPC10_17465 [Methylorubrum sp. B1-46]|uniref:hypothetical protein n=1 Tax=Methylorubrum TaxID=2282523 RepID=UPI001E490ED4|nr:MULTISPECIES: hypothetical protein [Methylorubrum]MCG5246919.1 hypothetical protein [Methylorubrum extorquens]UGB24722.1 hypothetical protein LPC10_17465 [Methylorubrum sp. B1-46]
MTPTLKPSAVLCRDGGRFAVETADGILVVTAPASDPALDAAGLSPYRDAAQPRPGVLRHSGVPVGVVRELIRHHGGFEAAGPDALAVLQAAGRPVEPEPAPIPEAAPAVEEAASRPFARAPRPEPRWPKPGWSITVCRMPAPYQH